ncbi:hypothetical protein BDZ97DRAFT_1397942 [Flammula alnicola]|nr:hypothetical protein BDZ97DRAFT_1397942 [Flammula alnicola]
MLSNSRNILITGGTFVENHHHISQYSHMMGLDPREKAWEKLLQNITPGAFHNSAERYDPPKCHPGTRKVILNKLMNWLKDPGNRRLFIWLYGPAGSGKSAIAQTIAEMCYQAGILAASFFFSRAAPGRNDDKFLISTLSYQLCILIPELRTYVGEAIDRDPSIYTRSLATQMQELIVNPLNRATQKKDVMARLRSRPMVIIIDGLDECGHGPSQRHILNTLSSSIHQLSIPLPFIISSRPEFDIRQAFNSQTLRSMMVGLALDDTYRPGDDIRVFLLSKFSEIRTDHPLRMYLPLDWPREPDLRYLVEKSSGQFIYASTVAKFVESHRHRPEERLRVVLGLSHPNDDRPFAVLDTLYRQILLSADNVEKVLEVLTFILLDFALPTRRQISSWNMNSPRISPAGIEDNLGYRRGDMSIILCDLHAILKFPVHERDALSLYHASLGDFLLDRSRSNNLFIDAETGHAYLARKCMQHISRSPGVSSQCT